MVGVCVLFLGSDLFLLICLPSFNGFARSTIPYRIFVLKLFYSRFPNLLIYFVTLFLTILTLGVL